MKLAGHALLGILLMTAYSCAPTSAPTPSDDPPAPITTSGALPGPETEIGGLARQCAKPVYCGDVGYVDCGAAIDRPAYYFDRESGEVLGRCGGYCMMQTEQCAATCPPPRWQCSG